MASDRERDILCKSAFLAVAAASDAAYVLVRVDEVRELLAALARVEAPKKTSGSPYDLSVGKKGFQR